MAIRSNFLFKLLQDAPPTHVFELSEAGIAMVQLSASSSQTAWQDLDPGVLSVSPVRDNIQNADLLLERIRMLTPENGGRKRRLALVLPDYCARVAVLDFDTLPSGREEQEQLIRFRMKKSVPFDMDSAVVSYYAQPAKDAKAKIEVVVAVVAMEILARYEAPFRQLFFQPGYVVTSALAALNLVTPEGVTLVAKLSGRTLTVVVLDESTVKLVRCMEMEEGAAEEIESVLHPTFAYIEDELHAKPSRMLTCGFANDYQDLTNHWQTHWGVEVEALQSRFGAAGQHDAGLLGYWAGVE
jgi:type IV pilus assembly protein PilM